MPPVTPVPDIDAFEKRAAVMEYEGGRTRLEAENKAAQAQGFLNVTHFRQALAGNVVFEKLK